MSLRTFGTMPALLCLALSLTFCSCSVLEDRSGCPCYTYLILDEFIRAGFRDAVISFDSGADASQDKVSLAKYAGISYQRIFNRSTIRVSVVSGLDAGMIGNDNLLFPYGTEADPVWMFYDLAECLGDEEYINAVPYKQYCNLSIVVDGLAPGEEYGCLFRIRASCCGIGLYSGIPAEGEYCSMARRIAADKFSVRIPRQSGNVLQLEIVGADSGDNIDAPAIEVLDLGNELKACGYDWTKNSLDDASAVVDCSKAEVTVTVSDWEPDISFGDIEI